MMDTKRLFTMMLVSFAVIFGWQMFIAHQYATHPDWKRPGQATTQPATAPTAATGPAAPIGMGPVATSATSPTTSGVAIAPTSGPAMSQGVSVISPATAPTTIVLGQNNPDFVLEVQISSIGAGVEQVKLTDGTKAADMKNPYTFQTPFKRPDVDFRPFATRSVTIDGVEVPLAGVPWIVESKSDRDVTFMLDLGSVRVRKTYQLTDKKAPGKGYELLVNYAIENKTAKPANVKLAFNGPTPPPHEAEQGHDVQVLAGYDSDPAYQKVEVVHHLTDDFNQKKSSINLTISDNKKPLLWGGTASVYFNALVRPQPLQSGVVDATQIGNFTASALNPESDPADRQVALTFETTDLPVAPGATLPLNNTIFLGPRQRSLLTDGYYAQWPLSYKDTLVMTSGPCGYCAFQPVINFLVMMLRGFHFVLRDWGLAIILLVGIVRTLLHPITKRSQVSMMKMGKMGPEMERLKAKYPDPEDKDELNKAMMQLYKEQGFTPVLGCLPMFLQMPIWIALYSALQTTFELRHAPFLWLGKVHLTWISDLARPDRLFPFGHTFHLPLLGPVSALNLLPILLAVVFFLQQKYTPKPPAANKDQEMQQKMMQWMSLLFPVFLYNGPSGLNLYILTSTTIGIFESKIIRDHIKQKEAEENAQRPIIVDAAPSRAAKQRKPEKKQEPKKKGLAGLLADLQAKAEEVRRDAEKKKG